MNRLSTMLLSWVAVLLLLTGPAEANPGDQDVPIAPIPPVEFQGWTNAIRLKNSRIEIVVVPTAGRILHIGPASGENLLRIDEASKGTGPRQSGEDWRNYGGDWLWPVAQSHWPSFQPGDWPPSILLDGRAWTANAWKTADGALCCRMTQEYGSPLYLNVSRLIRLPSNTATFVIRQRAERIGPSDIPVTLWNISQVVGATHVVMPVDADSAIEGGVRSMMFEPPSEDVLVRCDDAVVYDAQAGGESKLCSDSRRSWIAAVRTPHVIIEKASTKEDGSYPDGGCVLEMYSNTSLGYSEIETLSVEVNLDVGETVENTLEIRIYALPEGVEEACDLADTVREWMGEKKPAAVPAIQD